LEGIARRSVPTDGSDGFRLRAGALLDALRPETRMIVIGSPANPSGSLFRREDVEELARGLGSQPGEPVFVVMDEVYRELTFPPETFASMADVYPHTIVVQSLSKSCALTGLRVGFFIGPLDAVQLATRAHMLMMMSVSLPAQRVALEILRQPDRLRAHYPWYAAQRAMMLDVARANSVPAIPPDGAFYTMVPLPERWRGDSLGAANTLLDEHDLVTVPGSVFGSRGEGYLRVTWAADEADVREGFRRLGRFLKA
jgi:aminotransferase